jgi:hypothetical protein
MTVSSRFSSWRDHHLSKKKETKGFPKKTDEEDGFLATGSPSTFVGDQFSLMRAVDFFGGDTFLLLVQPHPQLLQGGCEGWIRTLRFREFWKPGHLPDQKVRHGSGCQASGSSTSPSDKEQERKAPGASKDRERSSKPRSESKGKSPVRSKSRSSKTKLKVEGTELALAFNSAETF